MEVSKEKRPTDPKKAIIRCFSGKADSARGFKADRIYFDEASFAQPGFIIRNVFAGMTMKNVMVLLISSPPTRQDAIFAQLFVARDVRGNLVVKVVNVATKCPACKNNTADLRPTCEHVSLATPPWMAADEEQETIRDLMRKLDPIAFEQEILGLLTGADVPCFPESVLNKLKERQRVRFTEHPEMVLIGIDPSGHGRSETGFCAAALCADRTHVV